MAAYRVRGRGRGRGCGPITPEDLMEQQFQMMQAMTNFVQTMQAGGLSQAQPRRDKRREFMQGRPPVFSHVVNDPMEAEDWIRAMEKQLDLAQSNNHEKVLYGSGQLQGAAQVWWESYQAARPPNAPALTWERFKDDFIACHVPEGLKEQKAEEFRNLRMGNMSMSEYHAQFENLSHYAPNEVCTDVDKRRHFLRLQLKGNKCDTFEELVNSAIVLDNEGLSQDKKRKWNGGQGSESNSRFRPNSQHGFQQRYQGPVSQGNQSQYSQRQNWNQHQSGSQYQGGNQRSPQQFENQTPRLTAPNNIPVKSGSPSTPQLCYRCGEPGHYANHCTKKQNQQTPQRQSSNHKPNGNHGRVNHVSTETV